MIMTYLLTTLFKKLVSNCKYLSNISVLTNSFTFKVVIVLIACQQYTAKASPLSKNCYITGQISQENQVQSLTTSKNKKWTLTKLIPPENVGKVLHISGPCTNSKVKADFYLKVKNSANLENIKFNTPSEKIFALQPFSKRALGFASEYQKLSDNLHKHIGEPMVITSLAFESHVVKDVFVQLQNLEKAILMGKNLLAVGKKDFKKIKPFLKDFFKLLGNKNMSKALFKYGIKPFFTTPIKDWGWHNLVKIVKDLEKLHENMSAMNMHIFSFMTSDTQSPLKNYYDAYREAGVYFNGRVDFPEDTNNLLKEAFYNLYLLYNTENLIKRKVYSLNFSLLLIAHEQMHAQKYYDKIKNQHELLAGSLEVLDPIGKYKLVKDNWANFNVRFSLDKGTTLFSVTPEQVVNNEFNKGTIPHYYYSRIFHQDSLELLKQPIELQNFKIENDNNTFKETAKNILSQTGCLGCHKAGPGLPGGTVGPDLGKLGKRLSFNEIKESIISPDKIISKHCNGNLCAAGVMPKNYNSILTEDEINEISNYLKELK